MIEFVALRPMVYSYMTDDGCVDKKTKARKKCVIKHENKFDCYKKYLEKK